MKAHAGSGRRHTHMPPTSTPRLEHSSRNEGLDFTRGVRRSPQKIARSSDFLAVLRRERPPAGRRARFTRLRGFLRPRGFVEPPLSAEPPAVGPLPVEPPPAVDPPPPLEAPPVGPLPGGSPPPAEPPPPEEPPPDGSPPPTEPPPPEEPPATAPATSPTRAEQGLSERKVKSELPRLTYGEPESTVFDDGEKPSAEAMPPGEEGPAVCRQLWWALLPLPRGPPDQEASMFQRGPELVIALLRTTCDRRSHPRRPRTPRRRGCRR